MRERVENHWIYIIPNLQKNKNKNTSYRYLESAYIWWEKETPLYMYAVVKSG